MPPQACEVVRPSACAFTYCSTASTSPLRQDRADMASAASPTTCGPAMLVPLKRAYPLPGTLERMFSPGPETSGFRRWLLSKVTGPRLLKLGMLFAELTEPT